MKWVRSLFREPVADYMLAVRNCFPKRDYAAVLLLTACFGLSWWIYVPIHELLHVAGCVLLGGTVTRLDLDPIYGAAFLQRFFPFVSPGSEYAGRVSGFDTGSSDLVYLATDMTPFLLTVFFGVPLVRRVAHRPFAARRNAALLGVALPIAYAPFISIGGDYYEMGSIVVSRFARITDPGFDLARWRGDDLGLVVERLGDTGLSAYDAAGVAASALLGAALIFLTLWLGKTAGDRLGCGAPSDREQS
jgi:hypothetical protein